MELLLLRLRGTTVPAIDGGGKSLVKNSLAKRRVRSSLKGVAVFSVLAIVSVIVWGVGWNFWIPLGLTGWFILDFVFERRHMKRTAARDGSRPAAADVQDPKSLKPEEFAEYAWRGENESFGTIMFINGRKVHIDLRRDKLLEDRRRAALDLIAQPDLVAANFEAFKRAEAMRQPQWAEEILQLEIDLIGLYAKGKPGFGEVYFTEESGGDVWFCGLEAAHFSELRREN